MRHVLKGLAWSFAIAILAFTTISVVRECQNSTEVTPVLEATTPEGTGPAESEEETVERELPPSGGIKLVEEG